MRIEIRQGKNSDVALEKALKILKKKTIGIFKELRERQKGFKKPSAIRHQKELDLAHKRKLRKRNKGKQWKKW